MKKGEETKARLVAASGKLLQQVGYRGAALKEVLRESGAPRGSLYFHFPGGKDELVALALTTTAEQWKARLEAVLDSEPELDAAIAAVCEALAAEMERSEFRNGCPLATATLEAAADNDAVQEVSERHYRDWEQAIAARLRAHGVGETGAAEFARFCLAAIEGALLLARAYRDVSPLRDTARMLALSAGALSSRDTEG
ncbi:TetR/AcrR family transcriptional regulator [Haliangium sp.]|uniref:TetR/AcrR family transcriptional regulator n=1 Tax=Haliangium sp. TaxID=2663208 RepID=UPI003D0F963E